MNNDILSLIQAGRSIIPVRPDKRPAIDWQRFQHERAAETEIEEWQPPIACVAGAVSGGVVCIDFDDKGSQFDEWAFLVCQQDPMLMSKLTIQRTPSRGWHCVYRCSSAAGNTKLAEREPNPAEIAAGEKRRRIVLIETRGEGGYFLIAPSTGYELQQGDFLTLPVLSDGEAAVLLTCARSLNQLSSESPVPRATAAAQSRTGITPFDDYDSREDPIPEMIRSGWSAVCKRGDVTYLRRPGKKDGISASWNRIPNRLYVFTTSTDFANESLYKPSAIYAVLNHRGDYSAAAKDLLAKGYGVRDKSKSADIDNSYKTVCIKASDFEKAINDYYLRPETKGKKIDLPQFGQLLRLEHGQLSVVSGVPTAGKSMFMDYLTMKTAVMHNWKWAIFSPENYPMEIHFNKLAITYLHRRPVGKDDVIQALRFVDAHYRFIDATEDELNIDAIMGATLDCKNTFGIDGLVIDPWNEIESNRPRDISETDYIGICLRRLRKFARKNKISLWIVAHPTKIQKDKTTGEYMVPHMYDISSSANWYNKVDNGIILYRGSGPIVSVNVEKVKYRDYGAQGSVQMKYDFTTGQYSEIGELNGF